MRQIKFRAWDKKEEKWIEDFLVDSNGFVCEYDDTRWTGGWNDFDAVLMQFTGLLDKNGKKIYEGDIVRYRDDNTSDNTVKIANVFWSCAADWANVPFLHPFAAMVGGKYLPDGRSIETVFVTTPKACEVIGNIHEHPHLLT